MASDLLALPKKYLRFLGIVLFLCAVHNNRAQQLPVEVFRLQDFEESSVSKFAKNKRIPEEITPQVLTALSYYPELEDTKIIFRFKNRKTPLSSRPRILGIFRKKSKRTYVITISTKTKSYLAPILFGRLPYNAQVGVLGHEIAHVSYYRDRSSFQLLGLGFKLGNDDFVDGFEFDTDARTIAHGLGHQLLAWSEFVREALQIEEWKGAAALLENDGAIEETSQRYMNPETIKRYMAEDGQYTNVAK